LASIKKEKIYEEAQKIVGEYESKAGISKNRLFSILQKRGLCGSKSTFEECHHEMLGKIIEMKPAGQRRKRCFLTGNSNKLLEFMNKLKVVDDLLSFMEKHPAVGDCFYIGEGKPYLLKELRLYIPDVWRHIPDEFEYMHSMMDPLRIEEINPRDHLDAKKLNVRFVFAHSYSLQARYDILITLPSFLVNFINHHRNSYSNFIRKKCMNMISPFIVRCYEILQRDYESHLYSKKMLDKFLDTKSPTFGYLTIFCCKSMDPLDTESEFLIILGRYYFIISTIFSKKMELDSCSEQKITSQFINTFFHKSLIPNNEMTKSLDVKSIRSHKTFNKDIIPNPTEQSKLLDQIFSSLTGRLRDGIRKEFSDPLFVMKYYIDSFFTLGIFSILEKRILCNELDFKINSFNKDRSRPVTSIESIATKNCR